MVYIRGDKAQYDAWEKLGNQGWNWDSVFSYYKKGENFTTPTTAQAASGATYDELAHGRNGPLTVGYPFVLSNSSYYHKARDTWRSLGLEVAADLNGGKPHGFTAAPQSLDRDANVRENSARAYYRPVESRKNLKILKGTVRRITWANGHDGEAVADGFEYTDGSGSLVKVRGGEPSVSPRKVLELNALRY
jgi:choline dehydrogenase